MSPPPSSETFSGSLSGLFLPKLSGSALKPFSEPSMWDPFGRTEQKRFFFFSSVDN